MQRRATEVGATPEKQLFYKMDDEIIKWIKEKADFYNVNPQN